MSPSQSGRILASYWVAWSFQSHETDCHNVPLSRDPLILSLMPQLPPLARFKLDVLFIGTVINQSPFFPSTSVLRPPSSILSLPIPRAEPANVLAIMLPLEDKSLNGKMISAWKEWLILHTFSKNSNDVAGCLVSLTLSKKSAPKAGLDSVPWGFGNFAGLYAKFTKPLAPKCQSIFIGQTTLHP